jgi:hypothetical protein
MSEAKAAAAPSELRGVDFTRIMQPYLTEPPILAQVLRSAMARARANEKVQTSVRFLEGVIGKKLTFTMADVAPLASVIRQRVGLKADAAAANAVVPLKHASIYAALLGQALLKKQQMDAVVALMRAANQYVADARAGPPTSLAYQMFVIAEDEKNELHPTVPLIASAGDSKDLYALMCGTLTGFKDGQHNVIASEDGFAAKTEIVKLFEDNRDGIEDLTHFFERVNQIVALVKQKIASEYDFIQPGHARRLDKKFNFIARDGSELRKLSGLASNFVANGRLFVKVK